MKRVTVNVHYDIHIYCYVALNSFYIFKNLVKICTEFQNIFYV
jgi:hypothetical protein